MAPAPPSSARQRQSWRDKRQVPHEAVGQSRRLRRWFFSLLGLLMVAILAWQIYNIFRPRAIVALLPVTSYHELVPPVRFGRNDCDRLAAAGFATEDLGALQTFTIFDTIGRKLRSQDTLIVYASAHGVSEDGEAFLLGSKAMEERQSRAKLADFLTSLVECQARQTIVFLDAGHLPSDPRRGMIVNEFPKLLSQAVAATGNPRLWVLNSCSLHEFSHVSDRQEQTVFGYYVAEGLAGAADRFGSGNHDGLVDLAELADYVAAGTSDHVQQQAAPGETQTPRLLWGGGTGEKLHAAAQLVEFPRWHHAPAVAATGEPSGPAPPAKSADKAPPSAGVQRRSPLESELVRSDPRRPASRFALVSYQDAPPAPPTNPVPAAGDKRATDKPAASTPADEATSAATAPSPPAANAASQADPAATNQVAEKPAAPAIAPAGKDAPPPAAADKPAAAVPPGAAATKPAAGAADQDRQRLRRKLLDRLLLAWQGRDRLLARPGGQWSPIDFAPHAWRAYEETLLSYEARCLAGRAFELPRMLEKLKEDALEIGPFPSGAALPPAPQRLLQDTSRYEDLRQLWQRFDRSDGRRDLETGPDARLVRAAWELRNDCLFRATDLLRWHARASLAAERTEQSYDDIRALLDQIGGVDTQLTAVTTPNPSDDQFETLRGRSELLRGTWQTLVARLQRRGEQLAANPGQSGARRELADLLSTPLLPAELRIKLLETQLAGAGERPLEREVQAPLPDEPPAERAWQRAREQATLEVTLLGVVDPKAAGAAGAPLAADAPAEALPLAIRRCGARLAEAYDRLPGDIETVLRGKDVMAAREADLRLRLVDGRDVARVSTEERFNPVQLVRWQVQRQQDVALAVAESLTLDHAAATPLEVTLSAPPGYSGEPAVVELRDPSNRLELALAERPAGVQTLPADTGIARARVKLAADQRLTLRYDVRPRSEQIWEAELEVVLAAGGRQNSRRVRGAVPRPQRIDLVVLSGSRETADVVRLRPFPNRPTAFQLGLAHHGERDRKVRVQLYGIDLPLRAARRIWDETGKLPDAKTELATLAEWTLRAGEEPQPLAFPPPKPLAPAADAKPTDAAAPAPPPTKPAPKPIPAGTLVCLVQDLGDPTSPPYATWLDVTVRHPRDYVTPNVRYDRSARELSIDLVPGDAELLAARAADPILVAWDTAGQIPPGDVLQPETQLRSPGFTGKLRARVEPGRDKHVEVRLNVDGYPRAFVFDVPCDLDRERIPRSDKLERVSIARHFEPDPKAKDDAAAPPKPKARTAYKAPLPARTLPVDVTVDAPDDAFQHFGAPGERGRDELQVGIDANRDRLLTEGEILFTAASDRQIDLAVAEVTSEGSLVISTQVRDFTIPLTPVELYNRDFDVRAQLSLAGSHPRPGDVAAQAAFAAIIDGERPKFDLVSVPRSVEQGAKAKLQFEVVDKTDIVDVFFVVDLDENGRIDEAEKPVHARRVKGDDTRSTWQAVWNTAEPKPVDPGAYILLVRAKDEVGNESLLEQVEIDVTEKKPDAGTPAAAKGSIAGLAHYGQFPLKGKVEIVEGPKKASQAADREGKFQFNNLPPGDYTLKAEGGAGNNLNMVGKTTVTVPPEGGKIEGVVIELDRAPKPPPIPGAPPPPK